MAAETDDNPLTARPDLIRRSAEEVRSLQKDPTPDDVLMYAAGVATVAA